MTPENGPQSFGTFEKRAPGLFKPGHATNTGLSIRSGLHDKKKRSLNVLYFTKNLFNFRESNNMYFMQMRGKGLHADI